MRIAFLSLPVPGHINPMTALARTLQARGHDVVFLSLPDTEPLVHAAQLSFVACAESDYPRGSLGGYVSMLSTLTREEALRFTFNDMMGGVTASLYRSLPATLAAAGADVMVLDQYHPYVELVPMSLGMPYAHVSNALHVDWTGGTPICFTGWAHETGPAALARNREGVARYRKMLEPTIAIAQDYARKSGLSIDWSDPHSTVSPLAWVTQTPRAFDFESAHRPKQFHYAGPFHDGHGRVASEFPWERLTGEPLVYVSMGTLQNGIDAVFRSIAEASGKHKGTQFVFSIGPQLDAAQIGNVPGNAIVVNHAPQLDLLKRSALCITHAGLNTVLEALTQGVPLLAIPVTNDQPGVAARVSAKGVGLMLALEEVTSTNISDCVGQILGDPAFSERSRTMQSAIALADGLSSAASAIEMAFGLTPVAARAGISTQTDHLSSRLR